MRDISRTSTECAPMWTGWFGIPGARGRGSTKVHLAYDGKPCCGTRLSSKQRFQWCSYGVWFDVIECEHCRAIAQKANS